MIPYITSSTGIVFTGTAEPSTSIEVRTSTGFLVVTGSTTASGVYTLTLPNYLPEGNYAFIITSRDQANNTSTGVSLNMTVDRTAPTITSYTHTSSPSATGAISFSGMTESGSTVSVTI